MTPQKQIEILRKKFIAIIQKSVSLQNGCIGMYYKNLGEVHTVCQIDEEYETTPIVVIIHSDKSYAFGGMEAATVYDIYLKENHLVCTLRNEIGDFFDESINTLAIESLNNITNWLYEHNFTTPESIIHDDILNSILVDEEQCNLFGEILFDEIDTDDEPYHKRLRQLIRAYRNNDIDHVLIALCGWSMETLILKFQTANNKEFNKMIESLYLLTEMGTAADPYLEIAKYYSLEPYVLYFTDCRDNEDNEDEWLTEKRIDHMNDKFQEMLEEIKKINPEEAKVIDKWTEG